MMRLNTGMTYEIPLWYNNFEILGVQEWFRDPSNHAHCERNVLNTIIKHTNFKLVLWTSDKRNEDKTREETMSDYIKDHPNTINIFWNSSHYEVNKKYDYDNDFLNKDIIDLCNSKNFIIFAAWTNITNTW
jgi:hypothetical protein